MIKINRFRPIVDLNPIEIVATIDRTAKFGSKMSIKRWFEYDLDQNLAQGQSNGISLTCGWCLNKVNLCIFNFPLKNIFGNYFSQVKMFRNLDGSKANLEWLFFITTKHQTFKQVLKYLIAIAGKVLSLVLFLSCQLAPGMLLKVK